MPQGWIVNPTTDIITFNEAPPIGGANNITITEYSAGAVGGTDCWAFGAWSGAFGYPTEVEFFGDRLWWAGTVRDPQVIWGSQVGDYSNHGKSTPIIDSDAVSFAINTRQVNSVMDLVPLDKMIILAKGGEFLMSGGQDDVITPSTISVAPQSYRGTGNCQARVVGDTAVFVQEQGSKVFDIGYRFDANGYRPQEISVWADHLIEGYQITRMDWMPAPWSVLWFLRDDYTLIGCSYMPEHEVIGWHTHSTMGEILDFCNMPGTNQTEHHIVSRRTLPDGTVKCFMESMADSFVDDPVDHFYVDCGLTYDGRNTTSTTLLLTGGVDWLEGETLTLTASSGIFTGVTDVGDGFEFRTTLSGVEYSVRLVIINYVSPTIVEVESVGTVPLALRNALSLDWTFMRDTISGLDHLEGFRVAILSDACVVSNGLDDGEQYIVTAGSVTIPDPGGVVTIGLPYSGEIDSLEINAQAPGIIDDVKLINSVGVILKAASGVRVGSNPDYMDEIPQRENEDMGQPAGSLNGYYRMPVSSSWGTTKGKVYLVADSPLPCEVLSFIPKAMTGETS